MQQTFHLDELDEATRDYLKAVRSQQGEGAPGVYLPLTSWLPLIGLIVGVVIIGCVLIFTLAPLDNPTGMALLQTAGLMLGGWLIVAALRVWIGAGTGGNLGHFVYADSQRLWQVQGGKVTVTELNGLEVAVLTDNYNDGNYQNTAVEMGLSGGRHAMISVSNQNGAHDLVNFLNALVVTRSVPSTYGGGSYQVGVAAKGIALGFYSGTAPSAPDDPALAGSPMPQRHPRPAAGLIACLVIVGIAVVTIFLMRGLNVAMRDHAIFDILKRHEAWRDPKNADYLRLYLLDPRNTRHVERVKDMLAKHYSSPVETIRTRAQDRELGDKFADLVDTLKAATYPAVSIRVTETAAPEFADRGEFRAASREARAKLVREKLTEGLCTALGTSKRDHPNQGFIRENDQTNEHPTLISFAQVPDDEKVLLEVSYKFVPSKAGPAFSALEWAVKIRLRPNDEAFTKVYLSSGDQNVDNPDGRVEALARLISRALCGNDDTSPGYLDPNFTPRWLNPVFSQH